jgi:hypothetical protein
MADLSMRLPALGVTRRLFVCSGLSACWQIAAQQPRAQSHSSHEGVVFDAQSLEEILRWARSDSADLPAGWRDQQPYHLAREQARWNGRPDPTDEVLQQLITIRQRRRDASVEERLDRTARLLRTVLKGRDDFLQSALPHLRAYLPTRTPIRAMVAMAAFLPNYAFSMNGTIVLSLTDRFWAGDAALVFNLLVHELFHEGFMQHQRGTSPNDAIDGRGLLEALLWQLQNEGMATYVAYRAKPGHLVLSDYELLEKPSQVTRLFNHCRGLIADIKAAGVQSLPTLRERLWRECNLDRLSYIVGAAIAQRIEQLSGLSALVKTIEQGPTAFLAAYQRTSPEQEVEL